MVINQGNNVFIGSNVKFGNNVTLGNNVTIYDDSVIGNDVIIMDNVVIGKKPTRAKASILPAIKELPPSIIDSNVTIGTSSIVYVDSHISEDVFIADLATVRERVIVGKRTIIGRGVAIENDCKIGADCKIETNSYITAHSTLENNVFIAPCVVFTNDNFMGRTKERLDKFKGPHVKKGGRIGANSTILPGRVIHEDGTVAASSVVTRDVLPKTVVMGSPATFYSDVPEAQLLENNEVEK